MKRTLFILLIVCLSFYLSSQVSHAAETTYYVDVDVVGGNGNGSSLANAYSSLTIAEVARDGDITAGNAVRFLCHNTLGGADASVTFGGWITDADSYVKVEAAAAYRHAGVWDASKYHMIGIDSSSMGIDTDYIRIDGIQFDLTLTSGVKYVIDIDSQNVANDVRISNCIIAGDVTGTGGAGAIEIDDSDAIVSIWNCVIYGFKSVSDPADNGFHGIRAASSTSVDIWNCTVNDCRFGIRRLGGTVTVVNCLVFENDDDFNGTIGVTYTASDDSTAGTGNFKITQTDDDYAALVKDADGGDFNITDASSELVGTGTDDPGAAIQDNTDIAGTARTSTWDIGAFEYLGPSVRIKGGLRVKGGFKVKF